MLRKTEQHVEKLWNMNNTCWKTCLRKSTWHNTAPPTSIHMAKNMFNKLYAIPTQHTNKHPASKINSCMVCLWQSQSANQNSNVSLQFISIYHSRSRVLFSRGSSLCIYYVSSDWTGQGADSSWIVAFLGCYMTIWPEGVPVISIQSVLVTRVSEQDTRYSLLQAGDKGVEGTCLRHYE